MIEDIKKLTKLVATYYRVSTSNQENEKTIESQVLAVQDFIKENNYTFVQEYRDEGWSGDNLVRPSLDQLRIDAKKKIWEAVVIYDPDRLARRGAWQEVVIEELKELGIEVLFVTVPPPKTDEDKIMYKMRGVFTEYERMKIKERFRLGKVRKASEGHIIASEAPYGYTFIKKVGKRGDIDFHQGYYEINPEEERVTKLIFSFVANERMTIRKVVKRLHELGIPPRRSKRGVWNTSTLYTMLRNETYIGQGHYGSSYAVVPQKPLKTETYKKNKKTSRKIRPREEWIIIPTPAILDESIFRRAQEQLKINAQMCQRNRKNEYLLSGKIRCICGNTRAGEGPQKGKHLYYRCAGRINNYPLPPTCAEKGVNARIADKLIWDKVSDLMSSPDLLKKQVERWLNSLHTKKQEPTTDIKYLDKEVSKLKEQEDRYNKAYGAGIFPVEKLKEYIIPIREKISSFESQITKAKTEIEKLDKATLPKNTDVKVFAEKSSRMLRDLSFNAKREIVMNVINKVVATQQELQVYGFIPITHVGYETSDRNCGVTKRGQVHAF